MDKIFGAYLFLYTCFIPQIPYFHFASFYVCKYRFFFPSVNTYKEKIEVHSKETDHNLLTNSLLRYMVFQWNSKADFLCLCGGLELTSNKPFTAALLSTENADRNAVSSKTHTHTKFCIHYSFLPHILQTHPAITKWICVMQYPLTSICTSQYILPPQVQ